MTDAGRSGDLLAGYPVVIELPVEWGDMDYFRHVNNTVFFRYFESARIAYLERIGFAEVLERESVGPILHSTHCRFRRPLTYPDRVRVGARATDLQEDRFTMEYRVVSFDQEAVAADGGGVVVSFDYSRGHKVPLPARVRAAIESVDALSTRGGRLPT
jgi:acyl-CoA thioester hydrolase